MTIIILESLRVRSSSDKMSVFFYRQGKKNIYIFNSQVTCKSQWEDPELVVNCYDSKQKRFSFWLPHCSCAFIVEKLNLLATGNIFLLFFGRILGFAWHEIEEKNTNTKRIVWHCGTVKGNVHKTLTWKKKEIFI